MIRNLNIIILSWVDVLKLFIISDTARCDGKFFWTTWTKDTKETSGSSKLSPNVGFYPQLFKFLKCASKVKSDRKKMFVETNDEIWTTAPRYAMCFNRGREWAKLLQTSIAPTYWVEKYSHALFAFRVHHILLYSFRFLVFMYSDIAAHSVQLKSFMSGTKSLVVGK